MIKFLSATLLAFLTTGGGMVFYVNAEVIKNGLIPPDCKEKQDKILEYISRDKKEMTLSAADIASTIPFDDKCGVIHNRVIPNLIKSGLFPKRYSGLILNTMDGIKDPSMDYRTVPCLQYIAGDGTIDEAEWRAGYRLVKNAKRISLPVYFRYLFTDSVLEKREIVETRITDVLEGAAKEGFGRMNSIMSEEVLAGIIKGVEGGRVPDYRAIIYVLMKYSTLISDNEDGNRYAMLVYTGSYKRLMDAGVEFEIQEELFSGMTGFLKGRKKSEGPARILIGHAMDIEWRIRHYRESFYISHLKILNESLPEWFCYSTISTEFMGAVKQRREYVNRNKISCR